MAKYTRMILKKLMIERHGPTIIFEDSASAITVANTSKPNGRTSYINISYFAIQEWVEKGENKLAHICGVVNPSDALTKALGWTLHHRHVTQMMGCAGCKHIHTSQKI
eukprot:3271518-Ditylum_brightwellii.AAC.1